MFSYGFIVLISLIAAANVFNTISTNISLRRREFAMLKSVGMTAKGFNHMMNFECLLYGSRALLLGLPLSGVVKKTDKDYKNNGKVKWNFTKFLIDRNGEIVARFEPTDMKNLKAKIEECL